MSLNRLYYKGRAAYGFVRNSNNARGLSKKKVEQFLQIKTPYTKFCHPIRRFEDLKLFQNISMKIGVWIWFFLYKLASQNNGVKYLLVAVDVFSRIFRNQIKKSKYARDILQAFKKLISRKKNTPEKLWVDRGTEYGETSQIFCKEKNNEVYSTRSETEAAFVNH